MVWMLITNMWLPEQKSALFILKLNSILLPQFKNTLHTNPSSVYQVLNVNLSAFLKGILPTLQSQEWNNGSNGECWLESGDLGLLPLALLWPTGVSLAIVWVPWLLKGCPKWGFLPPSIHPTPPCSPSHPPPLLLAILTAEVPLTIPCYKPGGLAGVDHYFCTPDPYS